MNKFGYCVSKWIHQDMKEYCLSEDFYFNKTISSPVTGDMMIINIIKKYFNNERYNHGKTEYRLFQMPRWMLRTGRASMSPHRISFTLTSPFVWSLSLSCFATTKGNYILLSFSVVSIFLRSNFWMQLFCSLTFSNLYFLASKTWAFLKSYCSTRALILEFFCYCCRFLAFRCIFLPFFSNNPIEIRTFRASYTRLLMLCFYFVF